MMRKPALVYTALAMTAILAPAQTPSSNNAEPAQVEKRFKQTCAGCHGEGGAGGDRAPALTNNPGLRRSSEAQIADLIKNGTRGGMPAFSLPEQELTSLARWVRSLNVSAFDTKPPGDLAAGGQFFFGKGQCSTCHMVAGQGKVNGPDLSEIGRKSTVRELELVLENPTSQMGIHTTATCPGWAFCPDETWAVVNVHLKSGSALRGFARNQSEHDIQLQTFDGRMHLLTDAEYVKIVREKESFMPPLKATAEERQNLIAYLGSLGGETAGPLTSKTEPVSEKAIQAVMKPKAGEWPTYNGSLGGNRYSPLDQINTQNVRQLQLEWVYALRSPGLQTTPLVSDGVMYMTAPDQVCALDSRGGREIWCYTRPSNRGTRHRGGGSGGSQDPNRGVAILGDLVFFVTGDAHLVCIHRLTGGLIWDVTMPETPGRYSATSAPLVVGDLVISGIAGGDTPLRGFLTAYKATTGEQMWRFWTIPKPGEPTAETWKGNALPTGGGATWLTGSYDAATNTLYWAVGNPYPATDGDEREGTNLYSNCVIALGEEGKDRKTTLVLPIHAARSARLGRHRALRAGRCKLSRPGAEAFAPGKSQWLLLCPRPDHRRVSTWPTFCTQNELGKWNRSRWQAAVTSGQLPHKSGSERLSISARSD